MESVRRDADRMDDTGQQGHREAIRHREALSAEGAGGRPAREFHRRVGRTGPPCQRLIAGADALVCFGVGTGSSSIMTAMRLASMRLVQTLRAWARRIRQDILTLWFAAKHPRTPWYAKVLVTVAVAYALSPIDLVPDFIPVLGYLDEVILLPLLIWMTIRLLPPDVLRASRTSAEAWIASAASKPRSMAGAVAIVGIWLAVALGLATWAFHALSR
jgi:uncharacterized membrane protein YkvA (DUF1232 family)